MGNRRKRTRVDFHTKVDMKMVGARIVGAESRDLSHNGVFVLGDHPLHEGQEMRVTVHLFGASEDAMVLEMDAKVARITKEGTAIQFVSMSPDTYLHLRNLVLLNAEDPDAAEKEFNTPGFSGSDA